MNDPDQLHLTRICLSLLSNDGGKGGGRKGYLNTELPESL